ncbi:MAG: HpcH/HpaI aldolase family protein [Planctomycetota bacterium]|jgi:4-hydroxy-2-oxoheptanedioate aldolase
MTKVRTVFVIPVVCAILLPGTACISGQTTAKQTDYLHLNKVIDKLERDRLVTGIWVSSLHPVTAISLSRFNRGPTYEQSVTKPMIDFILIDMEHEPFDVEALRNFLLACNSRRDVLVKGNLQPNFATVVRIPADAGDPVGAMIKQVLDAGAHAVMVPHVRNARDAEKVVKACRYPQPVDSDIAEPQGTRGGGPRWCSYLWGLSSTEYVRRADVWPLDPKGDLMAIMMIEDKEGVHNIEEILSVKGVGAVMFGPFDYSFAAGDGGNQRHPEVTKAWDKVKKACDRHNVPLIGFAQPSNIADKLKQNYKMLLIGQDFDLTGKAARVLQYIKKH